MTTLTLHRLTFVVLAVAGLGACTQDASSAQPTTSPSAQVVVQSADATPAALPRMTVHKTPTCGCCGVWIDHVQKAGFTVDVHDMDDLGLVRSGWVSPMQRAPATRPRSADTSSKATFRPRTSSVSSKKSRTHAAWSSQGCRLVLRAWRSRRDASSRSRSS